MGGPISRTRPSFRHDDYFVASIRSIHSFAWVELLHASSRSGSTDARKAARSASLTSIPWLHFVQQPLVVIPYFWRWVACDSITESRHDLLQSGKLPSWRCTSPCGEMQVTVSDKYLFTRKTSPCRFESGSPDVHDLLLHGRVQLAKDMATGFGPCTSHVFRWYFACGVRILRP